MIIPLLKGLTVTFLEFFKKPVTLKYPYEKREPYPRWRGLHRFKRKEDGKEKCVACCLCERVCPAKAISIEVYEEEGGIRYAKSYEIDLARCIFCGFCVEACPVDALEMTTEYELAEYTREDLICRKDRMLR